MNLNLKLKLENFKQVFKQQKYILIALVSALIIGFVFFKFTNYPLIAGNMGYFYANIHVTLQILLSVLFGVNIALLWHKLNFNAKVEKNNLGQTSIASILGLVVSGCPACGISLASYLGLSTFFSTLPFFGIELKIAALFLLLYSTDSLLKKVNICEVQYSKPTKTKNTTPTPVEVETTLKK